MGLLDEAIREHLDLMRRHGANEAEVARREAEALGPVIRDEDEAQEGGSPSPSAEGEPALPYDRAAEAGLTGESDVPSFEWHGSSSGEPEVPSFVSPEPARHAASEPDGGESQADAEVVSQPTEMFDVVGGDPAAEGPESSVEPAPGVEEPEVTVEPGGPEAEVTAYEDRSVELSPESPVLPEPPEEAAAPTPEGSFEPPEEPALPEEQPIEPTVWTEAEDGLAEAPSLEDETALGPAPTEGDPAASREPEPPEAVPGLGTEAAQEQALPPRHHEPPGDEATAFHPAVGGTPAPPTAEVEDLPPEPGPVPPEGGPLTLDADELPPEREAPPFAPGEVVEEPPVGLGPDEPPIDEPFVAGEEDAWREAGETPWERSATLPAPPLGGDSSSEDLDPYAAPPVEPDAVLEPGDEPPLDERSLRGPAPDAELLPPGPVEAGEPLDPPGEPPPPLPSDSEAARGFFDETAEYERPSRGERSPSADPDFEE